MSYVSLCDLPVLDPIDWILSVFSFYPHVCVYSVSIASLSILGVFCSFSYPGIEPLEKLICSRVGVRRSIVGIALSDRYFSCLFELVLMGCGFGYCLRLIFMIAFALGLFSLAFANCDFAFALIE